MLEKIREIICEFVDMDPAEITLETNIRKDLGLNSLELVNLAVEIEELSFHTSKYPPYIRKLKISDFISFVVLYFFF